MTPQYRARVAFLTDWALRDLAMARRQTRLDMDAYPGIELAVADQLQLREQFGRYDLEPGAAADLVAQMIFLPPPEPTKPTKGR